MRCTKYLLSIITLFLWSCNKNDAKEQELVKAKPNQLDSIEATITTNELVNTKDTSTKTAVAIKKNNNRIVKNQNTKPLVVAKKEEENLLTSKALNTPLQKFLNSGKIDKTYTREELKKEFNFTDESLRLIKSLTLKDKKTIAFKWKSTWFVESVSDAKFKDGNMSFDFKPKQTIIKGGAIGIKYKKKIHTNLIIKNGKVYIPSVKGFYWEVRK